ncbi:MAG: signal peptidase II [Bacillota bacterium]|nr:signal peptidase II [Bacillota bacterium]
MFRFTVVTLTAFALDQLGKFFVTRYLQPGESIQVLPYIFHLTYIENPGGAFGILAYQTRIFVALSICTIFLLTMAVFYYARREQGVSWSLAFLTAGILGNLADRLRTGYVIDFLDFRVWPVFNVADVFIFIGALSLFWKLAGYRGIKKEW